MNTSLRGHQLPESQLDFEQIKYPPYETCLDCHKPFSDKNVQTPLGWRETQISGICESCFASIFHKGE